MSLSTTRVTSTYGLQPASRLHPNARHFASGCSGRLTPAPPSEAIDV